MRRGVGPPARWILDRKIMGDLCYTLSFFLLILLFLDEQFLAINNIHTSLRDTLYATALQVVDRYCWCGLESV